MSKGGHKVDTIISSMKKKGTELTPFFVFSRGERGIRTLDTA